MTTRSVKDKWFVYHDQEFPALHFDLQLTLKVMGGSGVHNWQFLPVVNKFHDVLIINQDRLKKKVDHKSGNLINQLLLFWKMKSLGNLGQLYFTCW